MCASFSHAVSFPLKVKSESASCSVVSDSFYAKDYTVHGILQARILEWVAFPFSRGSSNPRDQTQVSHIAGGFFISWATREAPFKVKSSLNTHSKRENQNVNSGIEITYIIFFELFSSLLIALEEFSHIRIYLVLLLNENRKLSTVCQTNIHHQRISTRRNISHLKVLDVQRSGGCLLPTGYIHCNSDPLSQAEWQYLYKASGSHDLGSTWAWLTEKREQHEFKLKTVKYNY